MVRDCDVCGGRYDAKRSTSKYCSPRCRVRASRAPRQPVGLTAVPPLTPEQLEDGPLTRATLEELQQVGRDETPLGQVALLLARRLESPSTDTGSSIAALAREHRNVMEAALEGAKRALTPLDVIRARRRNQELAAGQHPHLAPYAGDA